VFYSKKEKAAVFKPGKSEKYLANLGIISIKNP
jgi:hypothetical protein